MSAPAPSPLAQGASPVLATVLAAMAGVLFGLGLAVAGMTDPGKVLAFLDVAGAWDPSLAFVMGGAVGVTLLGFPLVLRRQQPACAQRFHLPTVTAIDRRLVLGAATFGIGWGLTGYCPGPALATVLSANVEVLWFLPALLAGGLIERWVSRR